MVKMDIKRGIQLFVRHNPSKELYKCCDCGHEFDEYDAAVHFANLIRSADMLACPECDSEDLEDNSEGEPYDQC